MSRGNFMDLMVGRTCFISKKKKGWKEMPKFVTTTQISMVICASGVLASLCLRQADFLGNMSSIGFAKDLEAIICTRMPYSLSFFCNFLLF